MFEMSVDLLMTPTPLLSSIVFSLIADWDEQLYLSSLLSGSHGHCWNPSVSQWSVYLNTQNCMAMAYIGVYHVKVKCNLKPQTITLLFSLTRDSPLSAGRNRKSILRSRIWILHQIQSSMATLPHMYTVFLTQTHLVQFIIQAFVWLNTVYKQKESKTRKDRLEEHEYTCLEEYRTEKSLVLFPNDYRYMARVRQGEMVNLQMGVKAKDFVKAHMSLYRGGMPFP